MSGIDRAGSFKPISRETPTASEPREPRNAKVDEVAKLYEKQFLREMVKAMRGTVDFGEMTKPSMGENIYRDNLDNEYVESWGENGGIGLSNVIYEQIMSRYFSGPGAHFKAQGPIPLTDRDISRVVRLQPGGASEQQVPLRVELQTSPDGKPSILKAPWSGRLLSRTLLTTGQTSLTMDHSLGLRSTLTFDGVAGADLVPGQKLEQGKTLGIMSPESRSFVWNLRSEDALASDQGPAVKHTEESHTTSGSASLVRPSRPSP